jgi:hypothetical protein
MEEEEQQPEPTPTAPAGEIAPGCSEPNKVPPSAAGTSQDPTRKEN